MRYATAAIVTLALLYVLARGTATRDRIEMEERLYGLGMAVDLAGWSSEPVRGKTLRVPKLQAELEVCIWKELGTSTAAAVPPPAKPAWQLSAEGHTLTAALGGMELESYRTISLEHLEAIVVGGEMARVAPAQVALFAERSPEVQGRLQVAVTKGRAGDVLERQQRIDRLIAPSLAALVNSAQVSNNLYSTTLEQFAAAMISGQAAFLPDIEPRPDGMELSGLGVFLRSRLVGWLNPSQVQSLGWVRGDLRGGVVEYRDPEAGRSTLSGPSAVWRRAFLVSTAHTRLRASDLGNRVRIVLDVWAEGNDVEDTADVLSGRHIEHDDAAIAAEVRRQVAAAIDLGTKHFKADIFGFGDALHRHHPWLWAKYSKTWDRDFVKLVDVRIGSVSIRIRRAGLMQ